MSLLPPELQKHLQAPHNGGARGPDEQLGLAENQVCGDLVEIGLEVRDGQVVRAGFRARGCSATIAVASLACEAVEGHALEGEAALDVAALVDERGGLPPTRRHAVEVVTRALRGALAQARAHGHPGS